MKTFNSRFLKTALALVLCLMMLASTTVTGFAAVVENSSVKANADIAQTGISDRYYAGDAFSAGWNPTKMTVHTSKLYSYAKMSGFSGNKQWKLLTNTSWAEASFTLDQNFLTGDGPSGSNKFSLWGSQGDNRGVWRSSSSGDVYLMYYPNGTAFNQTGKDVVSASTTLPTVSYDFWLGTTRGSTTKQGTMTVNGSTATIEVDLNANTTYYYGINRKFATSSDWFGNTGTMTDTNCSNWQFDKDAGDCGITTKLAGKYKFTYTLGDLTTTTGKDKMSVTYPVPTTYSWTASAGANGSIDKTSGTVNIGSSVTINATPNTGYSLGTLTPTNGTATKSGNTITFTPSANNASLSVAFAENKYNVNVVAGTGGTVGQTTVSAGIATKPTISASNSTGYHFVNWTATDGVTVTSPSSASTTVSASKAGTVTANFAKDTYTISFNANGGSGSMSPQSKTHGVAYTLPACTITPPALMEFDHWGLNGVGGTSYAPGTTYAGNTDATFYAVWKNAGTCSVSFAKAENPQLVMGGTFDNVASTNEFCTDKSQGISYESSQQLVASVSSTGHVVALTPGTTTITATCNADGTTASYQVTVLAPTITLSLTNNPLNIGYTSTASVVVSNKPVTGTLSTTYSSGTTSVATVSGATITAVKNGTSVITATYKVDGVTRATDTKTLTVNEPSFNAPSNMTLEMSESGASFTDPSVSNTPASYNFTYTVKSGNSITISGKNITAVKPGATTVTRKFTAGSYTKSQDFTVTINDFNVEVSASTTSLAVNAGGTVTPTVPTYGTKRDISYAIDSSKPAGVLSVNSTSGAYTAKIPGNAEVKMTVVYTWSDDTTTTKTATTNTITVAEPTASITPASRTLNVGQSQDLTVTPGATAQNYAWSVNNSNVSINNVTTATNTATAVSEGSATVTATINYNASYSKTVTASFTVTDGITVSKDTVNLEYYATAQGQKGTDTFTVTLPATDITPGTVNVTSADGGIATGQYNNGTVTVTAHGVGSTTVTVSYTPEGATNEITKDITVNVTQYDPNYYLYFTDSWDWKGVFVHMWGDGGNQYTIGTSTDNGMVKIGNNSDGNPVYAIKVPKQAVTDKKASNVIFVKQNDWGAGSGYQTTDTPINFSNNNAYYPDHRETQGDENSKVVCGTWTFYDKTPTVSLANDSVPIGTTKDITATTDTTKGTASEYAWSYEALDGAATLGTSTTDTVSITGTKTGDVKVGVRAFCQVGEGCSLSSLNKEAEEAYPYISTYAEATVTVSGVQNTVNIKTKYRNNINAGYTTGTTGGTVSIGSEPIVADYTHSYDYNTKLTLTATPADGYILEGWYKDGTRVGGDASYSHTVTADVDIEARFEKTAALTLTPKAGVTYSVAGWSSSLLGYIPVGTEITVTANLDPNFTFRRWSTHTGSATSIVENNPVATFTMEVATILTPDVVAEFTMTGTELVIDSIDNATSVGTLTVNGESSPQHIEIGQEVTFAYTLTNTENYTFYGWYEGTDATHLTRLVTKNTSYTISPSSDVTLYAVVARKFYIMGDLSGGWDNAKTLTYNPLTRNYTYKSNVLGAMKIAPTPDSTDNSTWKQKYGGENINRVNVWTGTHEGIISVTAPDGNENNNCVISGFSTNYGAPVNVYWSAYPDDGGAYDNQYHLHFDATQVGGKVFLSNGRSIATGLTSSSSFVDVTGTPISTTGESGVYFEANTLSSVAVETTLGGSIASNYKVSAFVVYDKNTKSARAINDVNSMGNNKYAASIALSGPAYIYPVIENVNASTYVYVDATAIKSSGVWGPLVAAYTYKAGTETPYNAEWPGQLMIPSSDGNTWYMKVPSDATAVTFNNYLYNSLVESNKADLGFADTAVIKQTYDYSEMTVLADNDKSVITFVLKENNDGYHGDYPDDTNNKTYNVTTSNISIAKYNFDYLVNRDGVTPMTFTLKDAPVSPTETLYVVSKGDIMNSVGKWAVEWYIFDENGNYLAKVQSNALYDGTGDSNALITALHTKNAKYTASYLDDCAVKISYEKVNKGIGRTQDADNHSVQAFDGQWYGNDANETMHVDVKVGIYDNGAFHPTDSNVASYGTAMIQGNDGEYSLAQIDIPFSDNKVNIKSTVIGNYRFVGWYTKDEDGNFSKVDSAYEYTASVTNNKTFYAFFEQCGENELTVTNQIYKNNVDTEILSHDGSALMGVAIYKYDEDAEDDDHKGDLIAKAEDSKELATAFVAIESNAKYVVEITATPLNQGAFYAFYTDAIDKDGRHTYEEVLTTDKIVDRTEKVTANFVYQSSPTAVKTINIYTDVTKVENKAILVYKYKSRFGDIKTYTVKDVPLDDNECQGFDGNNNNPYTPSFLTRYIMSKKDGTDTTTVYGTKLYETMLKAGYIIKAGESPYNKVQSYSPTYNAANVWNQLLTWDVQSTDSVTIGKSIVTVNAIQNDEEFTVTYSFNNGSKKELSGIYNDTCIIEDTPAEIDDAPFRYWEEVCEDGTRKPISTSRIFGMRYSKDITINAVYSSEETDTFTPMIDRTEVTREYSDASDILYSDYLLHFANTKVGKELSVGTKTTYDSKEVTVVDFGLIALTDRTYDESDVDRTIDANIIYPSDTNSAYIAADMEAISAKQGNYKAIHNDHTYNYYYYSVKNKTLTSFNRIDYIVSYNNRHANMYKNWTFSGYAFIKYQDASGNYYFDYSEPANVELFTKGNASPSESMGN